MQALINYQNNLLKQVNGRFYRFLYDEIDWSIRMIGIKGPRGTGKTTLMLQRIKYGLKQKDDALYLNVEHPWFYTHSLFETVTDFYDHGVKYIFIDEVHKYDSWSRELKVIYDGFPDLRIVFSASSALEIFQGEADLSRRLITYHLPGLSFREYLLLCHKRDFPAFELDELIKQHVKIRDDFPSDIKLLPLFKEYLASGYLLAFKGLKKELIRIILQNILNTTLSVDLQQVGNLPPHSISKLKKVLGMIAEITPYEPNISALAHKINISRNTVLNFIHLLERSNLLNFLIRSNIGISKLQKPDKIYLENTNLSFALSLNPDAGTLGETFFLNQLINAGNTVVKPPKHDFLINNAWLFEVGGKNKKLPDKDVLIAMDGIDKGFAKNIPLWMFGFLY